MFRLFTVGLLMVATGSASAAAGPSEAMEVEHARMNARAGGPISEHDAWLLERYGCYAETRHPVCDGGRNWRQSKKPADRKRKHQD